MPGLTTIMVLTNVGLQLYNNWRNAQTSEEMRKKQQAFQEAAQGRNHDNMMQLLREGQELQEQMEIDLHNQRVENIENDFDSLIKRIFQQQALQQWPLRVLPMVMKNQSLGSYLKNRNENIALHVIFTPSNCDKFNTAVFPQIEIGIETFINQHWNTLSSHPIIFYSGAWKSNTAPTHNEIDQLRADLSHLPVLMVTPYFQPNSGKLVFNINMWGMGNSSNENDIDINAKELIIQPTEQELSLYNIYARNMNYGNELKMTTIKEFVPYLQCMIGYLTDVYFWTTHNRVPILPSLITIGAISTSGMKYLVDNNCNHYEKLLLSVEEQGRGDFFVQKNLLNLYEGCEKILDEKKKKTIFNKIVLGYFNSRTTIDFNNICDICSADYTLLDISTIEKMILLCPDKHTKNQLQRIKELISLLPLNLKIKRQHDITLKTIVEQSCTHIPINADKWNLIMIENDERKLVVAFFSCGNDIIYRQPFDIVIYLTKHFIFPRNIPLNDGIEITTEQLRELSLLLK